MAMKYILDDKTLMFYSLLGSKESNPLIRKLMICNRSKDMALFARCGLPLYASAIDIKRHVFGSFMNYCVEKLTAYNLHNFLA